MRRRFVWCNHHTNHGPVAVSSTYSMVRDVRYVGCWPQASIISAWMCLPTSLFVINVLVFLSKVTKSAVLRCSQGARMVQCCRCCRQVVRAVMRISLRIVSCAFSVVVGAYRQSPAKTSSRAVNHGSRQGLLNGKLLRIRPH